MDKMKEEVLCIKSDLLFKNGRWDGLKKDGLDELYQVLLTDSEFKVRGELEEDPSYKQIIPQVVLRYEDRYFLHKQANANEERLNSLCPLFLGGHVEEFDMDSSEDLIQTALKRELAEEAVINSTIIKKEFLGLIYLEDDNPVNHVHVGLMYIFDLDGDDVKIKEEGLENIGFVDVQYLKNNIDNLTYWSKLVVDQIL